MRLLEIDSGGELLFSKDFNDNIPAYAILSHTWGPDEDEVTFNDIRTGSGKSKPGYKKLQFCGQQAKKHGLQYFWVDTCNIDKANHSELSEAITSMFKWYYDSVKCYVYLSDVSIYDQDNNNPTQRPWESAFRKSRWFKRGWTLQELLAPKSVEFFSHEGEYLGNRILLEQTIHEITNIPLAALQGTPLSGFSNDEKMRWAAGRQTKRKEDEAYCLLGIFGVYMYLNYGEGGNAIIRLKRAIRRPSRGLDKYRIEFSLRGVPVVERFADRPSDLAELGQALLPGQGSSQRQIFVLSGLGGMGKTQLAANFARRNSSRYSAVFWLDGTSEDSLKQSIVYAASRLPSGQNPEEIIISTQSENSDLEAIIEHFLDWLSQPDNDSWLIVFDNVDREYSAKSPQQDAYDITRYFPRADHGSILVTTRLAELRNHGTAGKKLQEVNDDLAKAIFCKWYTRKFDENNGAQLLDLLHGLPLALTQAAAYMQQTGTGFVEYIDLWNSHWRSLMQSHEAYGKSLPQYDRSIWTTWMISFDAIQKKNEAAADLLLFWAHLSNRDVWYGLFKGLRATSVDASPTSRLQEAYRDEIAFTNTIGLLLAYCLVEKMESQAGYILHPMVHRWAQHVQTEQQMVNYARLAVIAVGSAIPSASEPAYWIGQQRMLEHAECCFKMVVDNKVEVLEPDNPTGEQVLEHNCTGDIVYACHSLGDFYSDQGKLDKAEEMYKRALQGKEKALGAEHQSTLDTVNNLGVLYESQGKLDKAEEMYERALQGYEKALGAEHLSTLDTVNNLGILYESQGKLDKAEEMFERALQGYEKALGGEHLSTLDTVNNLGILYKSQGKLDKAEEMYERALQGKEKALGAEHLSTLNTVNNLGVLYESQGKLDKAEEMFEWALQGYEKALGGEHLSTLNTVNNLGVLYRSQGKLDKAEEMYKRALQGKEKALGGEHLSTLNTVNNLGVLYRSQGKLDKADEMYERALQGYEKALGAEHLSTLNTVNNLGVLYESQGKLDKAEEMFKRALQGYEKALGAEHLSTLNTVNNLGILYESQGKLDKAEEMFERALQGYEKALGGEHLSTLNTVNNLGILKLDKAEEMFKRALQGYEKALGLEHMATHIPTLNMFENFGHLQLELQRPEQAKEMFQRALVGCQKALGQSHKRCEELESAIAQIKFKQRSHPETSLPSVGDLLPGSRHVTPWARIRQYRRRLFAS